MFFKSIIITALVLFPLFYVSAVDDGTGTGGSVPMPTTASSSSQQGTLPRSTVIIAPASPTLKPTVSVSATPSPSTSIEPSEDSEAPSNSQNTLFALASAAALAVAGYVTFKSKNKGQPKDENPCGSIKELLEQKKREMEEMVKSWPQDKAKDIIEGKITDQIKKNEVAAAVLEMKEKYDKAKEVIETLQKKFDLCMLENVSLKGGTPALSFLMAGKDIQDQELKDLGIEVVEKDLDDDRKLKIPPEKQSAYLNLVKSKLAPGFWNEVVSDKEIIFIFKFKDGAIKQLTLSPETEKEISELCTQFNNDPIEKTKNVYKYISENSFYHDFMLKHYSDLIDR